MGSTTIMLTPKEALDAYASLTVELDSGRKIQVSITGYRCANTSFGKDAQHGGTQDAVKFKDKVLGASNNRILRAMSASDFVGVFLGKGSRANIVTVLQWVEKLKLQDSKLPTQTAFQKICDDYIGLDCNGFVGNWGLDNSLKIDASTPPSAIGSAFRANKRTKLEDIQPYDVLVWKEHVAVVESIPPAVAGAAQRVARVAEAYGAIMCQDRTIQPGATPGTFRIGGHTWADAEVFGTGLASRAAPLGGAKAGVVGAAAAAAGR